MSADPSDAILLRRARAGDHSAFGMLFDRHVDPVYWQAYRVLRHPDEAQDVAQDTFVTAWRRRYDITIVDESVLPWLLVTARLTAQNARRRLARLHPAEVPDLADEARSAHDQVSDAEVRGAILAAVDRLSATDRRLFSLCIEQEHSYAEAAATLGVSHGVVRNRLSRLRGRLRGELHSLQEDS